MLQELSRATDSEWATLRMLDVEMDGMRLVSAAGTPKWDRPLVLPLHEGLSSVVMNEGAVSVANDYPSHPNAESSATAQGAKSMMTAPVVMGTKVVGTVTVVSTASNHYTDERVALLPAITEALGVLLERANLVQELEAA